MGRGWGGGVTRWIGDVGIEAVRSPDMSEEIPVSQPKPCLFYFSLYILFYMYERFACTYVDIHA